MKRGKGKTTMNKGGAGKKYQVSDAAASASALRLLSLRGWGHVSVDFLWKGWLASAEQIPHQNPPSPSKGIFPLAAELIGHGVQIANYKLQSVNPPKYLFPCKIRSFLAWTPLQSYLGSTQNH